VAETFFFFGSLMDPDVARLVLGRTVPEAMREPATLAGYRRAVFAGESYPVIVPRPGGRVQGEVVRGIGSVERDRITWFEEGEYDVTPVAVELARGGRETALACLSRRELPVQDAGWDLARWQRDEKAQFLELAALWMSLHGKATVAEADAQWDALKRARGLPTVERTARARSRARG